VAEGDIEFLQQVHKIMKLALKCKQTVDVANAELLKAAISDMGARYHHHEHNDKPRDVLA
jgi:hypothetical protein